MRADARDLRRRIQGTDKIQRVTRALEQVATVRALRARARLAGSEPYLEWLGRLARHLAGLKEEAGTPSGVGAANPATLVALGPDRGLCGGLGHSLALKVEEWLARRCGGAVRLVAVGRNIRDRLRARGLRVDVFHRWPAEGGEGLDGLISELAGGARGELHAACTRFVSGLRQVPRILRLLPLASEPDEPDTALALPGAIYEPAPALLLEALEPELVRARLQNAFLHSALAEASARRGSMTRASENARTLIEELTLTYHRARQDSITAEVRERAVASLA